MQFAITMLAMLGKFMEVCRPRLYHPVVLPPQSFLLGPLLLPVILLLRLLLCLLLGGSALDAGAAGGGSAEPATAPAYLLRL
jgi:hypothetical protein